MHCFVYDYIDIVGEKFGYMFVGLPVKLRVIFLHSTMRDGPTL